MRTIGKIKAIFTGKTEKNCSYTEPVIKKVTEPEPKNVSSVAISVLSVLYQHFTGEP